MTNVSHLMTGRCRTMIKAVVFDLDDTLISEYDYIKSGFTHISRLLEPTFDRSSHQLYAELLLLYRNSPKNVFNRLYDLFNIDCDQDTILTLVNEFRHHDPVITMFPDVLPLLTYLKDQNIATGIITDGYLISQQKKLDTIKAAEHFNQIIMTDELGRAFWKPHPLSFEIMKERMDIEFEEILYIGDNPNKDFYIGSIHPITTVRIHRNGVYETTDYYEGITEHYSINSLDELRSIINSKKSNQ